MVASAASNDYPAARARPIATGRTRGTAGHSRVGGRDFVCVDRKRA